MSRAPWGLGAASVALVALLLVPTGALAAPRAAPPPSSLPAWIAEALIVPRGAIGDPLPPNEPLRLTLALQPDNGAGLAAFDRAVADPRSPDFGRFLTEPEFEAQFAPPPGNLSAVEAYLRAGGGRAVEVASDHLSISTTIRAGDAPTLFGATVERFGGASAPPVLALSGAPSLPPLLRPMIASVGGLYGSVGVPTVSLARPAFLNGTGAENGTQWFVGSDYVGLYDENPLFPVDPHPVVNASFAQNETVATLLESGYNGTNNTNLPPWDPAAISAYFNETFPSDWPAPSVLGVPVTIAGITPPSPGPPGPLGDDSGIVVENALDLEMAGSLAPGVQVANFYFAASLLDATPSAVTGGQSADDFATELGDALSYNYSPRHLAAVSASLGAVGLDNGLWDEELAHAASIGVTVIASSGDSGDAPAADSAEYLGAGPPWPAAASFNTSGAVAVGGVTLASSGSSIGTYSGLGSPALGYDPNSGPISGERAWYDTLGGVGNYSGSEGGAAANYTEPEWQFESAAQPAIATAEGIEGVPRLERAVPDVALAANDTIVFAAAGPNGTGAPTLLQGTSIGAPILAGMVAEWAAVLHHGLGFLDPAIYRIASFYAAEPGAADPFLDVTSGGNYAFSAAPGWDAVTGWGGIDGARFLSAYQNETISGYLYDGPTPGIPNDHPALPTVSPLGAELLVSVGVLLVGVAVLWVWLDRRESAARALATPRRTGAPMPEGGTHFECPYCGEPRPAEPVRCPACGRL